MASAENDTAEQLQAVNLWTFVHLKTPLFPHSAALDVVKKTAPQPGEDLKKIAKRLRTALEAHHIKISHTSALDASAKLGGFNNWFEASKKQEPKNRLAAVFHSGATVTTTQFSSWSEAKSLMCKVCETRHAATGANIFEVKLGKNYLILATPITVAQEDGPRIQSDTLLIVNPITPGDSTWLEGAEPAIEAVRRRLEETGKATLDGAAVALLCDSMLKAVNSELIVLERAHELDPGFEVARGDEMECWAELELASKTDGRDAVLEPEFGAWKLGTRRFVFSLTTIGTSEFHPLLETTTLTAHQSEKLFRRYRLLKGRAGPALRVRQTPKNFEVLGAPAETYRVDLPRLLLEMNKKGLTWASYCEQTEDTVEMTAQLPLGFLLRLLERLELANPNVVFARPNRAQLSNSGDVQLLHTLLPRIGHIQYRARPGMSVESVAAMKEAIEELSGSLMTRQLTAPRGSMKFSDGEPVPHLVYAYEAEELIASLGAQGLVAYAGVLPHLKPIAAADRLPNSVAFSFGLSLYLDIDLAGSAA